MELEIKVGPIKLEIRPDRGNPEGYWMDCDVKANFDGFSAFFGCKLEIESLKRFLNQLKEANEQMKGSFEITSNEEQIYLFGTVDLTGTVQWNGKFIHPIGIGNKLEFSFDTDFNSVSIIIQEVEFIFNSGFVAGSE